MQDHIFENMQRYFPRFVEQIVEYHITEYDEIVAKLTDGRVVIYDDRLHTIRTLPSDCSNLSESEYRTEFGIRLRKMMHRRGITQEELSDMTNIARPIISNYINGKNTPGLYNVDKIVKALNCSIDDLRYIDLF
jgi:DNA-binding Xre family transcriptional regulator